MQTNITKIKASRTLNLLADSQAYEDIQFSFTTAKVPASNFPTWTQMTTNIYKFVFSVNDYIDLEGNEVIHSRAANTNFYPHLHIYTNGVDIVDKYVKYQCFYTITNVNTAAIEANFSKEFIIPANTANLTHLLLIFDTISGVGINHGSEISIRFKRIASSGDAPSNSPFVSQFGIHVVVDSIGSNTILEK